MMVRSVALAFVAGLLMLVVGCGDDRLKTYPVSGTVLYNGQPLAGVEIAFHALDPVKSGVSYPPHAKTDSQGKFKLTSYVADDGCPAGEFKVALAFAVEVAGGDDGGDQSKRLAFQVPVKYHKGETSGLTATIKAGTNELEPFKLEGPPKK